MGEITEQMRQKSKEFPETKPLDYHRYLVVSLGTGLPEQDIKFDACRVAKWGIFGWLGRENTVPLLQMFMHASSDMTDSYVADLFKAIGCSDQLLRVQVYICWRPSSRHPRCFAHQLGQSSTVRQVLYALTTSVRFIDRSVSCMQDRNIPIAAVAADLSTEKNLRGLVKIAENLLHKPLVGEDDYKTDDCVETTPKDGRALLTYAAMLARFAKLLSDERKLRLHNMGLYAGRS